MVHAVYCGFSLLHGLKELRVPRVLYLDTATSKYNIHVQMQTVGLALARKEMTTLNTGCK